MVGKAKRETLSERTTEHLLDAIVHRQLAPGQRIVDGKLAGILGVAKSTLREALQRLEHQELVMKFDNQGTYVTKLGREEIDDSYALRLLLGREAAARIARLRGKDYAKLVARLEHMSRAVERKDYFSASKGDLAPDHLIRQRGA